MKKSKKKKLVPVPRLLKLCHALWSIYVRTRDKTCVMCHTSENLQAHHCIIPKGKSSGTRYLVDNGITLCYRCHIKVVHRGQERKNWFDKLKEIIDSRISLADQAVMIAKSHEQKKWTREELQEVMKSLEDGTKKLLNPVSEPPAL